MQKRSRQRSIRIKNKCIDAQMAHESRLQEIKDRRHDAFMHKFHLIDLLRMSKYTLLSSRDTETGKLQIYIQLTQFLYKNGLYIVIILIFIALCIITPIVKNTQLFTVTNILNILQQASPRMFLALGVAGSDPLNRYRPFCRTYGWYGYGYSNHYYA